MPAFFIKGLARFFSDNEQNAVALLHRAQIKHAFLVKTEENEKSQKQIPKKKFLWDYCIRD